MLVDRADSDALVQSLLCFNRRLQMKTRRTCTILENSSTSHLLSGRVRRSLEWFKGSIEHTRS